VGEAGWENRFECSGAQWLRKFARRIAEPAALQAKAVAGRMAGRKWQKLDGFAGEKKWKIYLTRVGVFR
jgi:hypothetical protein